MREVGVHLEHSAVGFGKVIPARLTGRGCTQLRELLFTNGDLGNLNEHDTTLTNTHRRPNGPTDNFANHLFSIPLQEDTRRPYTK